MIFTATGEKNRSGEEHLTLTVTPAGSSFEYSDGRKKSKLTYRSTVYRGLSEYGNTLLAVNAARRYLRSVKTKVTPADKVWAMYMDSIQTRFNFEK